MYNFLATNPLQRLIREAPDVPPAPTGAGPGGLFLTARAEEEEEEEELRQSTRGAITLPASAVQSDWPPLCVNREDL